MNDSIQESLFLSSKEDLSPKIEKKFIEFPESYLGFPINFPYHHITGSKHGKKLVIISTIHGDVKDLLDERMGKFCLLGFDKIICVKKGDGDILRKELKGSIVEIPAFVKPVLDLSTKLPDKLLSFLDAEEHAIKEIKNKIINFFILTYLFY